MEREDLFREYLRYRRVSVDTIDSYVHYINRVSEITGVPINFDTLNDKSSVNVVINLQRRTGKNIGSIANYKSAMRMYVDMVNHIQGERQRHREEKEEENNRKEHFRRMLESLRYEQLRVKQLRDQQQREWQEIQNRRREFELQRRRQESIERERQERISIEQSERREIQILYRKLVEENLFHIEKLDRLNNILKAGYRLNYHEEEEKHFLEAKIGEEYDLLERIEHYAEQYMIDLYEGRAFIDEYHKSLDSSYGNHHIEDFHEKDYDNEDTCYLGYNEEQGRCLPHSENNFIDDFIEEQTKKLKNFANDKFALFKQKALNSINKQIDKLSQNGNANSQLSQNNQTNRDPRREIE